ncbi:hypothetical protein [Oceanithermus sp.]|uniref:hypothetical protein n=1 Tax=Oceanithermus sp. TaxID=2268145 RepID=UPI00257FF25D|nr:hypothetical protein [Oceanithermus sp.]
MTGYLILDDLSTYDLDLLDTGLLAAWRRQLRLARAVESDSWTAAGGGKADMVEVELAVRIETGSAIGDAAAIEALLDAAARTKWVGIYLGGGRVLERNAYGLLRTASAPMGRGWRVTITLACGPEVWAAGHLITETGDYLVTDAGERLAFVEVY